MSTVVNQDIIRAAARLRTASGDDIVNVFHFRYEGGDVALDALANSVAIGLDAMYDNIASAIPADVTFVDIDVQNLSDGQVTGAVAWPTQTVGGGSGDTAPQQCTANVLGTTAYSHTAARKFLGPFIKSALGDGVWGSGVLADIAAFAADFINPIAIGVVGEVTPVVIKLVNGAVLRVADILATQVNNTIYTQRRRRPGVGA